jgi:hypothetical protein
VFIIAAALFGGATVAARLSGKGWPPTQMAE